MNVSLLAATVLILVLGAAHSYLGERFILVRLFRRADLPRIFGSDTFTRHTLRFAWHLTTVVWYGIAVLLYWMAGVQRPLSIAAVGAVVSATAFASAVVAFIGSRARHPAWVVFLAVAALVWHGTH